MKILLDRLTHKQSTPYAVFTNDSVHPSHYLSHEEVVKLLGELAKLLGYRLVQPGKITMLTRAVMLYIRWQQEVRADKKRAQWERDEARSYEQAAGKFHTYLQKGEEQ